MAPSRECLIRVQRELQKLSRDESVSGGGEGGNIWQVSESIWLRQNSESDLCSFSALIGGNEDTPYAFGLYLFSLKIPGEIFHSSSSSSLSLSLFKFLPSSSSSSSFCFPFQLTRPFCADRYPFEPPKVLILTVDGRTRINPNLYANGKVCLSILGTWSGPGEF